MECRKGGRCIPYSEMRQPSRVSAGDWCVKCGQEVPRGEPQR